MSRLSELSKSYRFVVSSRRVVNFVGCGTEGRNFPLLFEEGWTRPQQNIAQPPLWSGRGGDPIPPNFVEVEHHPVCASFGCFATFSGSRSHPSSKRRGNSPLKPFGQQPRQARVTCSTKIRAFHTIAGYVQ